MFLNRPNCWQLYQNLQTTTTFLETFSKGSQLIQKQYLIETFFPPQRNIFSSTPEKHFFICKETSLQNWKNDRFNKEMQIFSLNKRKGLSQNFKVPSPGPTKTAMIPHSRLGGPPNISIYVRCLNLIFNKIRNRIKIIGICNTVGHCPLYNNAMVT